MIMDFIKYTQLLQESKGDMKTDLIHMFKKDKLVTIKELEEFAKEHDVDFTQVQYTIFEFLHNLLYRKGKDFKYSHDEYVMGVEDEMEHTKDKEIAKSIALDHLRLDPNYYTKIKKAGL